MRKVEVSTFGAPSNGHNVDRILALFRSLCYIRLVFLGNAFDQYVTMRAQCGRTISQCAIRKLILFKSEQKCIHSERGGFNGKNHNPGCSLSMPNMRLPAESMKISNKEELAGSITRQLESNLKVIVYLIIAL